MLEAFEYWDLFFFFYLFHWILLENLTAANFLTTGWQVSLGMMQSVVVGF